MGDGERGKERLDVFFISKDKSTKRVTFRRCTHAGIKDILDKAEAVVELFNLCNNVAFTISDEPSECHEPEVEE